MRNIIILMHSICLFTLSLLAYYQYQNVANISGRMQMPSLIDSLPSAPCPSPSQIPQPPQDNERGSRQKPIPWKAPVWENPVLDRHNQDCLKPCAFAYGPRDSLVSDLILEDLIARYILIEMHDSFFVASVYSTHTARDARGEAMGSAKYLYQGTPLWINIEGLLQFRLAEVGPNDSDITFDVVTIDEVTGE